MTINEFAQYCCSYVEIYSGGSMPIFRGDIDDFDIQDAEIAEISATEYLPSCCGSSDDAYAVIAIYLKC